jgi:hypothetical protein
MSTFCKWHVCAVRMAPTGCTLVLPPGNTKHPQIENKGLIGFDSQLVLIPRCRGQGDCPTLNARTESTIPVLAWTTTSRLAGTGNPIDRGLVPTLPALSPEHTWIIAKRLHFSHDNPLVVGMRGID